MNEFIIAIGWSTFGFGLGVAFTYWFLVEPMMKSNRALRDVLIESMNQQLNMLGKMLNVEDDLEEMPDGSVVSPVDIRDLDK